MGKKVLTTKAVGECKVIYANEYLNDLSAEKLEDECDELIQKGTKKIIVNFGETQIVNSIGISVLISIIKKIKKINAEITFCDLRENQKDTFSIVGITKHIPIFATEAEALTSLEQKEQN